MFEITVVMLFEENHYPEEEEFRGVLEDTFDCVVTEFEEEEV